VKPDGTGSEVRQRFDFFVQHLLGVTPPPWNRPAATTSSDGSRPQ
jgi:hypothetical protein